MSLDATRWAWQQVDIKPADKIVLLSMADRADEYHRCYPSISRLAYDTCLNRKTVIAAIGRLQKSGLISAEKTIGSVSVYTLIGVQDRHEANPKNGTSPKSGTSPKNGTTPVPKTGHVPVPKVVLHQSQKRDTNLSINLSSEPTKEPKKEMCGFSKEELIDLFENRFWPLWGKGARKADARKWFLNKAKNRPPEFFDMLADKITELHDWRKRAETIGAFVPSLPAFAVWLNGERWEDELPEPTPQTRRGQIRQPGAPTPADLWLADQIERGLA